MSRILGVLFTLFTLNAPLCTWAASAPADAPPPEEQPNKTPRNRLLDLSAEVLKSHETQWNVLWARFAIGLGGWLQLSTHLAADAISLVNLSAKARLLDTPQLKASAELGGWNLFLKSNTTKLEALSVPMELRGTVPLGAGFEADVAAGYRWLQLVTRDVSQGSRVATLETSVVRYDARGAWFVQGKIPLFTTQTFSGTTLAKTSLSGTLTVDDLSAWSLLVGRDLTFKKSAHFRAGLGYRNRPGIILVESLGQLMVQLDLYWR